MDRDGVTKFVFNKNRICSDISKLIHEIEWYYTRDGKIACARKIFQYLERYECKCFMDSHNKFKTTVINKLHDLYNIDGLREAKTWYRRIFGERMPLEKVLYQSP